MSVDAIVLAGGRSTRFGGDKLAAPLGGGSVLAATIDALGGVADRVIVAGPPEAAPFPASIGQPGSDLPVTLARDTEPFGGPLAALAAVLASTGQPAQPGPDHVAIVVGGDMPRLVPEVLVLMLDVLDADPSVDAVYLGRPPGPLGATGTEAPRATEAPIGAISPEPPRRQVLPLALRHQPASRAAREAVEAGHRSLQALVDRIPAIELPADTWLPLDPEARTLTDVDTQADLDRLNTS